MLQNMYFHIIYALLTSTSPSLLPLQRLHRIGVHQADGLPCDRQYREEYDRKGGDDIVPRNISDAVVVGL